MILVGNTSPTSIFRPLSRSVVCGDTSTMATSTVQINKVRSGRPLTPTMGSSIDVFWTVSITAARATLTRPDRPRCIKKATLRDNLRVRDGQFMKSLRFTLYNVEKQVPLTCYVSIGLHSTSSPPVSYWYQKHSTSPTAHSFNVVHSYRYLWTAEQALCVRRWSHSEPTAKSFRQRFVHRLSSCIYPKI